MKEKKYMDMETTKDIYVKNIADALLESSKAPINEGWRIPHWPDEQAKKLQRRAKIDSWLHAEVRFYFLNRWKEWLKYPGYFIIWLGTELQCRDDYKKDMRQLNLDLTIANFGFKIKIRPKDFCTYNPFFYMPHQKENICPLKP